MTVEVTTQPTAEPLTLDEVKTFLNLTSNDHDAMLEMFIQMARVQEEKRQGRALLTQTIKQYWDEWPTPWTLGITPAASVTSIQYIDENGATQTWNASNYTADLKSTIPRIIPTQTASYPALGQYPNAVICTYTAGYISPDNVPADTRAAMLQRIAFLYEQREDIPIGGVGAGYRIRSADALSFQNRVNLI